MKLQRVKNRLVNILRPEIMHQFHLMQSMTASGADVSQILEATFPFVNLCEASLPADQRGHDLVATDETPSQRRICWTDDVASMKGGQGAGGNHKYICCHSLDCCGLSRKLECTRSRYPCHAHTGKLLGETSLCNHSRFAGKRPLLISENSYEVES